MLKERKRKDKKKSWKNKKNSNVAKRVKKSKKMKQWQEDQELKQLKEEREKEKRQEREARERVLAQIAQDKAERAAKFTPPHYSSPITDPAPGPSTSSKPDSNTARLQFKMPDGSTKTQDFPSTDKLISAVNYVKANLNVSSKFTLSTTFPRKQFTEKDHEQTLAELQLTPNAVILVLPLNHGAVSTNQGAGGMMGFVYSLLTPLFGILNFIKAFFGFGGDSGHVSGEPSQGYSSEASRSEPENPRAKPPPSDSKTVKKQGNIRRLADINKDDDENNTWNGNSTEQM